MNNNQKNQSKLPQGLLWSKDINKIDLNQDKIYIIHQVLSYGDLNQIKQLFRIYPIKDVQEVFLHHPQKTYSPAVFNFIRKFILNLDSKKISEADYVKTSF